MKTMESIEAPLDALPPLVDLLGPYKFIQWPKSTSVPMNELCVLHDRIGFACLCHLQVFHCQEGQKPLNLVLRSFKKTFNSFHPLWCKLYSWLKYSQRKDSAYCYACKQLSMRHRLLPKKSISHWKKSNVTLSCRRVFPLPL